MKKIILLLLLLFASNIFASTEYPSGKYIMEQIDKNLTSTSRVVTSTMVIRSRRGTRRITAKTWAIGQDKSFSEYLSPAREKGTKMLKLGDKLWTYTPMADRIITIAGHMLRQSVMGSDLSYEDFMNEDKLKDVYNATVIGEEIVSSRNCYVLKLTANTSGLAYHSRKIWVDMERFLPLKTERFAKSGKLLKTSSIPDVFKVGERWYPKRMVFKDVLKIGKGTELIVDRIEFDVEVPEHLFSKAGLRK
ncbi:outer membrane lipoprotein-sorting protein [Candidatus Margulisiibacteriota bacterium]